MLLTKSKAEKGILLVAVEMSVTEFVFPQLQRTSRQWRSNYKWRVVTTCANLTTWVSIILEVGEFMAYSGETRGITSIFTGEREGLLINPLGLLKECTILEWGKPRRTCAKSGASHSNFKAGCRILAVEVIIKTFWVPLGLQKGCILVEVEGSLAYSANQGMM
jgi:hypothetical protein